MNLGIHMKPCVVVLLLFFANISLAQEDFPSSDRMIVKISVEPAKVTLKPGEVVKFKYICTDANGREIPAFLFWSYGGGTLKRDGTFTAGDEPGTYALIASISTGVSGKAEIVILPPPGSGELASLAISPDHVTLKPGETCQFKFLPLDKYGKPARVPISMSFNGGDMEPDGKFTAGTNPGIYWVKVTSGSFSAQAQVTIRGKEEPATGLFIFPEKVTLSPGEKIRFRIFAKDQHGEDVHVDMNLKIQGGTMTQDGTYTAGADPGSYYIEAQSEGLICKAEITIVGPGGEQKSGTEEKSTKTEPVSATPKAPCLKIVPENVTLAPGAKQQFRFCNEDGNAINTQIKLSLSGGRFTPDGVYTAGNTPGNYKIRATTSSGLAAEASITITGPDGSMPQQPKEKPVSLPPVKIEVIPNKISLKPGDTCKFQCKATDAKGNEVATSLTWSYQGGMFDESWNYKAGYGYGEYRIIARDPNGLESYGTVTIESPGEKDIRIMVTPYQVELKPGQSCKFQCSIVDKSSNPVKGRNLSWSFGGGILNINTLTYTAGDTPGHYSIHATLTAPESGVSYPEIWGQAWIVIK